MGCWLVDGRGRWRWLAPLFPAKLSSVVQGSTILLPLSSSPPVLRAELLAYNLPDIKSLLLLEHTPSGPSAFANQTQGLCLAGGPPLHPSSLPPVRGARTAPLPFLPSPVGLSSALGSGDSVLPILWRFSGLFRQVELESKLIAGRAVSPASSYAAIFPGSRDPSFNGNDEVLARQRPSGGP